MAILSSSGPQIEMSLHSIFASRKRNPAEEEKQAQVATMLPSNFQVYAKIDEESRRDNRLVVSFLLTLNDAKGSVTYEFRGTCGIVGSSADFDAVMESHKDARVPKILDMIYQRMYPVIYMLAGMTMSSYPQSIALLTEMVSSEPIQVHQEAEPVPKPEEKPRIAEKPAAEKPAPKPMAIPAEVEAPKPTIAKAKKPEGEKTAPAKA
jgi:hypothetical protein